MALQNEVQSENLNGQIVMQRSRQDALRLIKQVRKEFTDYYNKLIEVYSTDEVVCDLMARRGYTTDEMYKTLKEVGLIRVDSFMDLVYSPLTQVYETHTEWGLTDKNGVPHLSGRYIVPIRDIHGFVPAIVGWLPDSRKYITTPTFGFARDAQFFNIECYRQYANEGKVFLVEGIYDTLSLRSQSVFALGNMGLYLSPCKAKMLSRFGKVYAIPDADKAGRGVFPHRNGKNKWAIPGATFVKLSLEDVKDADDAVKLYDIKADLEALETKDGYSTKICED